MSRENITYRMATSDCPDPEIVRYVRDLMENPLCVTTINELSHFLSQAKSKATFYQLVNDLFETFVSYGSTAIPICTHLVILLGKSTFVTVDSKKCFFGQALMSGIMRAVDLTTKSLYALQRKMPFVNELIRQGFLSLGLLRSLLSSPKSRSGNNEIAIRIQIEVVRNVCSLLDSGAVSLPANKANDDFWRSSIGRIKTAIERQVVTDPLVVSSFEIFLAHLAEHRSQWLSQSVTSAPQINDARTLLSRPNLNIPPVASAVSSPVDQILDVAAVSRPPPPILKKTIVNRLEPAITLAVPERPSGGPSPPSFSPFYYTAPKRQITPITLSVSTSSLPSAVSPDLTLNADVSPSVAGILEKLAEAPATSLVVECVEELKEIFLGRSTEKQLIDDVREMLDFAKRKNASHEQAHFERCLQVIGALRGLQHPILKSTSGSSLSIRDVISACAVDTKPVQTTEQVDEFCRGFPFLNELCQLDAVRRDIFQVYILRMTNTDSYHAIYLLFEIMKNFDKLIEEHGVHLNDVEFKFWSAVNVRMWHAIHAKRYKLMTSEFVETVKDFLGCLSQKGGWDRNRMREEQLRSASRSQTPLSEVKLEAVSPHSTPKKAKLESSDKPAFVLIVKPDKNKPQHEQKSPEKAKTSSPKTVTASPQRPEASKKARLDVDTPVATPENVSELQSPERPPKVNISQSTSSVPISDGAVPTSEMEPRSPENRLRILAKSLTLKNCRSSVDVLKEKLRSSGSVYGFTVALEVIAQKLFELVVDEKTVQDVIKVILSFSQEDYGRGKNFMQLFKSFCLSYMSGRNSADLEKLASLLQEKMAHSKTADAKKVLEDKMQSFEGTFSKRRIGCIQVVGQLFSSKVVDLSYMKEFCDAMLVAGSEHGLEGLKVLLGDVGRQLAESVRDQGDEDWWVAFFDEMMALGLKPESCEKMKKIIREIILMKAAWPDVEAHRQSREKLSQLLEAIAPEQVTREKYEPALTEIRALASQEFADGHTRQFVQLLADKLESLAHEVAQLQGSDCETSSAAAGADTPLPGGKLRKRRWDKLPSCSG